MMLPTSYIVMDLETTGLNPWYGDQITCIGAKDSDGSTFLESSVDELSLITGFLAWVKARAEKTFVTANGQDFDIPFLLSRGVLPGILLDDLRFLLAMPHFDLQHITKRKISLNDLATLFLDTLKTGFGEQAIWLFRDRNFHALKAYCMSDVELTERVFLAYRALRENPGVKA